MSQNDLVLSHSASATTTMKTTTSSMPLKARQNDENEMASSYYGWRWIGRPRERLVLTQLDGTATRRKCYPAIRHVTEGDVIRVRDTVLLRSASAKDLPYIAKIAALWENEKGRVGFRKFCFNY